MNEFEPSSDAWNWEWRSSSQVPTLGIGNVGVRVKFRRLESGTEEVRSKFRCLESGMEEFEPSSELLILGIGNGRV